jgi:PadR family transcriptional regulator AphA
VPPRPAADLSLADHVCLALVVEGVNHGWAIGSLLAPRSELGRIWSLSRPLTYRSLDLLAEHALIVRRGTEQGRGRERTVWRATAAGRRATAAWLDAPVEHLRDVRTELLLKMALRQRAGLDVEPLADAQRREFAPRFEALATASTDDPLVSVWREESARAVRRFLDRVLDPGRRPATDAVAHPLRLSARNQLVAVVTALEHGDVMSIVRVTLPDGQRLTASITKEAALELDLAPGDEAVVIVKASEVMIARP